MYQHLYFLRRSFLICPPTWGAQSPWRSDNLWQRNNGFYYLNVQMDIKAVSDIDSSGSSTFSVVSLRSVGDEDPGQSDQQSHH